MLITKRELHKPNSTLILIFKKIKKYLLLLKKLFKQFMVTNKHFKVQYKQIQVYKKFIRPNFAWGFQFPSQLVPGCWPYRAIPCLSLHYQAATSCKFRRRLHRKFQFHRIAFMRGLSKKKNRMNDHCRVLIFTSVLIFRLEKF